MTFLTLSKHFGVDQKLIIRVILDPTPIHVVTLGYFSGVGGGALPIETIQRCADYYGWIFTANM